MDEARVLESIRSGDLQEFSKLVEYYQIPITRYLYHLTGNWETARDLAQDTFIQAYKSIPRTSFDHSFKAWLYRVATNAGKKYLKKNPPYLLTSTEDETEGNISAGCRCSGDVIEDMFVRETLLRIDKDRRVCMLLHFWEGLKYREIAGILGTSEEAVRKRVSRGCHDFKRLYRAAEGGEG